MELSRGYRDNHFHFLSTKRAEWPFSAVDSPKNLCSFWTGESAEYTCLSHSSTELVGRLKSESTRVTTINSQKFFGVEWQFECTGDHCSGGKCWEQHSVQKTWQPDIRCYETAANTMNIKLKKWKWNWNRCLQNLFEFDFKNWRGIGIVELEFSNIKECDSQLIQNGLHLVLEEFIKTRQSQLRLVMVTGKLKTSDFCRKITFTDVDFPEKTAKDVETLFGIVFPQCEVLVKIKHYFDDLFFKNITILNSNLPHSIDLDQLNSAKFDHFRWVSSSGPVQNQTDAIIRKLQNDMRCAVNKRSFLAEMDSVSVEAACDFLEVCETSSHDFHFWCLFSPFLATFTFEATCC